MAARHVIIVSCSKPAGFFSHSRPTGHATLPVVFSSIGRMLSQPVHPFSPPPLYLFTKNPFCVTLINKWKKKEVGGGCCSRNKSGGRWPSSRTWETHKKIIKEGLEPLNSRQRKLKKTTKQCGIVLTRVYPKSLGHFLFIFSSF